MSIKNRTATVCILSSVFSLLFLLSSCFDGGGKMGAFLSEIDKIGNGYEQNGEKAPPAGSSFECYVSDSGNNYYDGTQAMPVKTLGRAAQILRTKNVETKTVKVLGNLTSTATDTIDNSGKTKITITTDGSPYTCAAQLVIGAGATVTLTEKITFSGGLTVSGNLELSGTHTVPMSVYLATGKKIEASSFANANGVTIIPAVYNAGLRVLEGAASGFFTVQSQIVNGDTIVWDIDNGCLKPLAVYYVSNIGNDANDGLTNTTPFKTLRHAFDLVVSIHGAQDKTIHVAGVLDPTTEGVPGGESVFVLNTNSADNITIDGGGSGVLSGALTFRRVVHIKRGKITFKGMKIIQGNGVSEGAGVYIEDANSVVKFETSCSFLGNTTASGLPTSGKDIFKKEGTLKIGTDEPDVGVSSQLGGTNNVYVVL